MKRVLAVLLCLLLAFSTVLMTACSDEVPADPNAGTNPDGDGNGDGNGDQGGNQGGTSGGTHVHTYKTDAEWSLDATGHWYDATCDCADATVRKLNHVDDNKDGACDVCKYSDHEHFYSEDWTADCTNHWNAADCGCIIAGENVEAHADNTGDGVCDTCAYVIENLHNHYYATEWSNDSAYHWHAALCEHGVEVAGKAAHEINNAGDCVVCGAHVTEINAEDIAAVLAAAQANEYKIAFGDVIAVDRVYGGTGAQTLENGKTNKVHFALGNGESYIQYISFDMNGVYIGQEEQWHEALGNDQYFAVAMLNGDYELSPIAGDAQFLNGYNYIPGSIIPSDSADTSTLANMLSALYNQMKAGTRVSNAAESVENGIYAFSYTYYSVNPHTSEGAVWNVELEYYNVTVEFTVNEDMIIDSAEFEVEVYRDYENDSDLDYTWVDNGDRTVTISDLQLKPTANPSFYNYTVSQTSGERTFTTPYPKASLIPTSFDFYYVLSTEWNEDYTQQVAGEVEVIGDYYEILTGTYAKFSIGDVLPKTASTKFMDSSDFHFSFVNNDPESDGVCWNVNDTVLNGYSSYSGLLKIQFLDPGEYTVTIGFGDVLKVFTLKIVGPEIPEVPETNASQIGVLITDNDAWIDHYSYTAAQSGTYTFNLPAGLGLYSDQSYNAFGNPEVQVASNTSGRSVTVEMNAGDVYGFYVSAANKNTAWTITVDFVAAEGGDQGGGDQGGDNVEVGDITGTYYFTNGRNPDLTVVIDATTVTFTSNGHTLVYTYKIVNGAVELKNDYGIASSMMMAVELTDGAVSGAVYNGYNYNLVVSGGEGGEGGEGGDSNIDYNTTIVAGSNTLYFSADEIAADTATRPFSVTADGNYKLTAGSLFISSITDADGNPVTKNEDYSYDLVAGEYTVTFGMLSMFGVQADVAQELNVVINSSTGEGGDEIVGSDLEGAGTEEDPYVIPELGDYVCAFPGGWNPVWFTYTATANGYLTVSTTYASGWLQVGTDIYSVTSNVTPYGECNGDPLTVYVLANTTYYIGVADWNEEACGISFTLAFEAFESESFDHLVGEWVYSESTNWGDYTYTLTINADGTGTYLVDDGWYPMEYAIDYVLVNGDSVTVSASSLNFGTQILACTYDAENVTLTTAIDAWTTLVFAQPAPVVEGSGTLEDAYIADESNTVAYPGGTAYSFFSYTVAADGTMTITFTGDNFYWMYGDGETTYVEMGTEASATFDVTEGQVIYIGITTADGEAGTVTFEIDAPEAELPEEPAGPDGSSANPFELQENNSCAFPGGWNYIFYKYTATEAGTLTITVNSSDFFWAYGASEYALENVGQVATADLTLAAGETIYIGMATYSYGAGTIDFTAAFVASGEEGGDEPAGADGTFANPFELQENNSCAFPGGWNYIFYKYTATEAGTLTITVNSSDFYWGYGADEYALNNVGQVATADITLAAGETIYIGMSTYSASADTVDFTASFTAGTAGGEEPVVNETPMVLGNNQVQAADTTFAYTAEADIVLNIQVGNPVMGAVTVTYSINGGTATTLASSSNTEVTLAAGDKLTISATTTNGYLTITVTEVVSGGDEGGDEGDEDDGLEGSGTSADPWIVDAAPWSYTLTGAHDKYFKFTATEKCTVTVVVPAGCAALGLPGSYTYDANENKVYSFVMEAGAEVTINAYRTSGSADYTYTLTTEAYVEPEPEPGEGGGEGIDGTYVSAAASNGKTMTVVIDTAADTMVITRSGSASVTFTYSDTLATANETGGTVSMPKTAEGTTSSISGITFDANGFVTSVTWNGMAYTNYTKQ